MNIRITRSGSHAVLTLEGRLDAYWAPHLSNELEQVVRDGADDVSIDLSGVDFLSSAGIGILLKYFKLLGSINGRLRVTNAASAVLSVLELSGLTALLLGSSDAVEKRDATTRAPGTRAIVLDGMELSVYEPDPHTPMTATIIGDPSGLEYGKFSPEGVMPTPFGIRSLAIGIGAFSKASEGGSEQYGEFLSVGGTSVTLPADRSNVPDFESARGTYIPSVNVLYAVHCTGTPSQFLRFETTDPSVGIPLSKLSAGFLDAMNTNALAYVIVGTASGLIGAALHRSPLSSRTDGSMFEHPEIRRWLTYTAEPAFPKALVLAVGIVSRDAGFTLDGFLRPLDPDRTLFGHTHAVAFTYHHMNKGKLDMQPTISAMFEQETPLGMLHLVRDIRPLTGRGESEFTRGAAWLGRLV